MSPMLDSLQTVQDDLHGGKSPWGRGFPASAFSFMASRIRAALCAGNREEWFDAFALDRPMPQG